MRRTILALCLAIAFATSDVTAIVFADAREQNLQSLLADAATAQSRGDFASAAEFYREATEIDPSVPELWANLGLMDHQIGKSSDAIQSFKHAIRLNPNLFVPQLFLGMEYLAAKNPAAALPYLETAEKLGPDDLQAALSLGSAYRMLNRPDRAADAYRKATAIAPKDGNAWLDLGTTYLQLVENDARVMTSTYGHSAYVILRGAETLADEGKLSAAENSYKAAIASSPAPTCTHAEYGITLLRLNRISDAEAQFEQEAGTSPDCGLAPLGMAMIAVVRGHPEVGLKELANLVAADPDFVQSALPLFEDVLSPDQTRSLVEMARRRQDTGDHSFDLGSLVEAAFTSGGLPRRVALSQDPNVQTHPDSDPGSAAGFYAAGAYARCVQSLKPALAQLSAAQQRLLASCSFYSGDFQITSIAAARLKASPATRLEGLYWESKADEKLAILALARAGELEPDSPRLHVLIGDVFRQKRHWSEAEAEYRKAIDLDPKSRAGRLSLAITLFTELKTDEALEIDRSLLNEAPENSEANLLAGEILVQAHRFEEAEPYLSKCKNLDPDLIPRLHILLGQVYAATNRIPEAISEYKFGLAGNRDEDGSVHYQLARLYQTSGNKAAAAEQFRLSQQLRKQWDEQAKINLGQLSADPPSP